MDDPQVDSQLVPPRMPKMTSSYGKYVVAFKYADTISVFDLDRGSSTLVKMPGCVDSVVALSDGSFGALLSQGTHKHLVSEYKSELLHFKLSPFLRFPTKSS